MNYEIIGKIAVGLLCIGLITALLVYIWCWLEDIINFRKLGRPYKCPECGFHFNHIGK